MSEENVEIVRCAMRAYNDRDIPALESILAEDFVYRLISGAADLVGSEFRGRDAALALMREWNETIHTRLDMDTSREVNDQVLVITNLESTGIASGVTTTRQFGQVFSFRDGRISNVDAYYTVDEALKAVGLSEEAMSEGSTTPDLIEIVHRSVEAMNRRELDTLMSFFAGDCVWDLSPMGLGTYRSRSAIRAFLEDWIGSYERFELALEEVVGLGTGVAFAVVVQHGRLVESAGELDMRYASVNSGVDGLFERVTNYSDINEARVAAERLAEERG